MRVRSNKKVIKCIAALSVVVLLFVGAYLVLHAWETKNNKVNSEAALESDDTPSAAQQGSTAYVYFDGVAYTQKDNISTLLILGIDSEGKMEDSGSYLNDGQNDFNALVILDEDTGSYTILQINRDTIMSVQQLGIGGAVAGASDMQLALAHTYGGGMEDSCENTVAAVENFLYGVSIDHYFSMNMSAVKILVDAVGGVTVTIRDDFSEVDDSLVQGETMTLSGEQCLTYIRYRKGVGDQTNISRSERQREFIYELLAEMHNKKELGLDALLEITDYIVTDLSANRLNNLVEEICDAQCEGIVTPEGETEIVDDYIEFYADDDSVRELVISLFYEQAEE